MPGNCLRREPALVSVGEVGLESASAKAMVADLTKMAEGKKAKKPRPELWRRAKLRVL